jgi:hypothetical protein
VSEPPEADPGGRFSSHSRMAASYSSCLFGEKKDVKHFVAFKSFEHIFYRFFTDHSFFQPILVIVFLGVPKPVMPFWEASLLVPD